MNHENTTKLSSLNSSVYFSPSQLQIQGRGIKIDLF